MRALEHILHRHGECHEGVVPWRITVGYCHLRPRRWEAGVPQDKTGGGSTVELMAAIAMEADAMLHVAIAMQAIRSSVG